MLSSRQPDCTLHNGSCFTLDLGAVHDPPADASNGSRRCMVQRLSHSTRSPTRHVLYQVDLVARRVRPQLVEQRFRFRKRQPLDIGIAAAAEIQHAPPGLRDACRPADATFRERRRGSSVGVTPWRT